MKPIITYLQSEAAIKEDFDNRYNNLDNFDKTVFQHLYIDYKYESDFENQTLLESKGLFDGAERIASTVLLEIEKVIKSSFSKGFSIELDRDSFRNPQQVFFKKLIIVFNFNTKDGGSHYNHKVDDSLDQETLLMNEVKISINYNIYEKNYRKFIYKSLLHELTHSYQDYQTLLSNDKKFDRLIDFYDRFDIKKGSFGQHLDEFQQYLRAVLYFTLGIETDAFKTELSAELKYHKKPSYDYTPLQAIEILRNTDIYKTYKNLAIYVLLYESGKLSKDIEETIRSEYNNICNTELSSSKVFKKLRFRIDRSIKKFDRIIGKLCLESLGNQKYIY